MLKAGKLVFLVLAIFIFSTSLSWAVTPGDANGDGKHDLADAMIILQTVAGLRPAIEGGLSYFPAVPGYSWTYDVTSTSGAPYTSVVTVTSANSAGFSVMTSTGTGYRESHYIYDGTALKVAGDSFYSFDWTFLSKNEYTPGFLVMPSIMVMNTAEATKSDAKYSSSTSTTVTTSVRKRFITVDGVEEVTTPAGTFATTKLTLTTINIPTGGIPALQQTATYWYAKNVGRVKYVTSDISGSTITTTTTVLKSYSQTAVNTDTDIQAITDVWMKFATFFATGLPSPTDQQFLALFSADYLDDGMDLNSQITRFTTNTEMIGVTITGVTIKNIDLATGTAWVSLSGTQNGQPFSENNNGPAPFKMVKNNGVWQIQGNRRTIQVSCNALALYAPFETDAYILRTGLSFNIRANTPSGVGVNSVVVNGPGISAAGITYTRQINFDWFSLTGGGGFYNTMNDATIAAIPDNATYTFTAKNSAGTVLATYTKILGKRPLMRSELSVALFPTVTAPTIDTLRSFNGGNLTVTWTMPSGLPSRWISLDLADTNWVNNVRSESSLGSTDLSKTLTIQPITGAGLTFTPVNRQIQVSGNDTYGRNFVTILY